jgi:hypothetical protein
MSPIGVRSPSAPYCAALNQLHYSPYFAAHLDAILFEVR